MKTTFDDFQNDRMIQDPSNYKWGIFYFNPKDSRIGVPKYNKMRAWTLNFGNLYSYLVIFGIIAAILISKWLG
ncbi:MAG: hypothetical protein WAO52_00835 [Prolixibacteraceae bacterium]